MSNLEAKFHKLEGKRVFSHELCNICRNGCINKEPFFIKKRGGNFSLKLFNSRSRGSIRSKNYRLYLIVA